MSAISSWLVADPPAISPAVRMMSVNWNRSCWNPDAATPNSKIGPRSRTPDRETMIPSVRPPRSARFWVPALYSCSSLSTAAPPPSSAARAFSSSQSSRLGATP